MAGIIVGNTVVTGFVNMVVDGRLIVGTGSYTNKEGEKVFKESITVFLNDRYAGEVPAKGDFVKVSGDLRVAPRKDDVNLLSAAVHVRFDNQLVKTDPPVRKALAAASDTGDGDNDI